MRHHSVRAPLAAEVARFQDAVRAVANDIVRAIVRQELRRRIEDLRATLVKPTGPERRARKSRATVRPAAPRTDAHEASTPPAAPPAEPKRPRWTRDAILDELASWLVSGTTVDASFVTRYGPPGLVAASRKEFGRFDAALNVASLRVSKLYPDGPPPRTGGSTHAVRA